MSASRSLVHRFRMRELKFALPQNNSTPKIINPFIPRKNPETNRWAPPRYSLRRQAELVKKARLEGTLHLLPPGPKFSLAEVSAVQPSELASKETKGKKKFDAEDVNPMSIEWLGEFNDRKSTGPDPGNSLYARKKQMFKGHKWERVIRRRRKYQHILMRDMPKRIWRWRQRRARRKPDPLSKPRIKAKESQKLPF